MTCIAGVVHEGKVWVGGDSAGASGWDITTRLDPKVFRLGEFVVGFTTSFRMGQLLRYAFTPPQLPDDPADLFRYMVVDFVGSLRDCLKTGGFAEKSNEREAGGTFLVAVRGRLFRVEGDYQVGESADLYDACGCGEAYAKGSLHSAAWPSMPRKRVELALQAAAHHSNGVRGPFVIVGPDQ